MRPLFSISTCAIFYFLTISFVAKGQELSKSPLSAKSLQFDTSSIAIIPLGYRFTWLFDSTYQPSSLIQDNLKQIDSLLAKAIVEFNNSLDKEHKWFSIDLNKRKYKKQYIAALNKKGEKEVWVNCFCSNLDNSWKTKIYVTEDGGNCFFYLKINLSTNKFYDLIPNSL